MSLIRDRAYLKQRYNDDDTLWGVKYLGAAVGALCLFAGLYVLLLIGAAI